MSLLDGLILDHLLQNVVKTEIWVAIRENLKNDPGAFGAGTWDDPYHGCKVVENLIKIGTTPTQTEISKGVYRTDYAMIKTFNNQTTAGKFLPCTNGTVQDPDMVKEMDNWLIAV